MQGKPTATAYEHGSRRMIRPNRQAKQVFPKDSPTVRKFDTGATRSSDAGKHDYEGFLSPLTIERYAEYMTKHRHQADGQLRDSDNWQKGMPDSAYMKSLWRHFFDVWKNHRGYETAESQEENLCAVIFNASGKLHEIVKARKIREKPSEALANLIYLDDAEHPVKIGGTNNDDD